MRPSILKEQVKFGVDSFNLLSERIKELEAENARYIERIEELNSELSKLKVQADRHREALEESCLCETGSMYFNPPNYICPACEALKEE